MKKIFKTTIIIVLTFIITLSISFLLYSLNYYKADKISINVLNNQNINVLENQIVLSPDDNSDTGIIFYPGAKIEYTAYLNFLNKLRNLGYNCFLVKMPFNFAFFNYNAADKIIEDNSNIKKWYMLGHSLGGAMASLYTSKNINKINGIILLGSYLYGEIPIEKSLVIYGSNDLILNKNKLNNKENEVKIEGGNHSQFGNYGFQKNDGIATISSEEQQNLTVDLIYTFINNKS